MKDVGSSMVIDRSTVVFALTGVAVCLMSPEVDSNSVCIQKYLMKKGV